jgi:hypothetical protein
MNINGNNYSVIEIINMLERRELEVNNSYQRGSGLWPDGPSSYFIDTILQGFPFPKIYMYEYMDRPNRGLKKINRIVDGIGSSNRSQLASAFGVGLAVLDLQLCRNASAHINSETKAEVSAARVRYSESAFKHPSDAIFWIDPSTNDYLWKTWIDEIEIMSEFAIA